MISKLPKHVSAPIAAQQYIPNTYIIVKELVENSIDANSTLIKISIDSTIIVEDNGDGIEDLGMAGELGHTSRDTTSYYVAGVVSACGDITYGYRGQALNAIKNVCDLEITSSRGEIGYRKSFKDGTITRCPRDKGTTVKVSNIFHNCPIRRKINNINIKKDISKISVLLEAYCYVVSAHFVMYHNRKMIFNKKGSEIINHWRIENGDAELKVDNNRMLMLIAQSPISKHFLFLGKRPIQNSKILSCIKVGYGMYNSGSFACVLVLKQCGDINISVDKSEILLPNESEIINIIKHEIERCFSARHSVSQNVVKRPKTNMTFSSTDFLLSPTKAYGRSFDFANHLGFSTAREKIVSSRDIEDPFEDRCYKLEKGNDKQVYALSGDNVESGSILTIKEPETDMLGKQIESMQDDIWHFEGLDKNNEGGNHAIYFTSAPKSRLPPKMCSSPRSTILASPVSMCDSLDTQTTVMPRHIKDNVHFQLSERINTPSKDYGPDIHLQPSEGLSASSPEVISNVLPLTEAPVSVTIEKSDFHRMFIVGQFNHGFIITTLKKDSSIYILAVDQHAADEIGNFERLSANFSPRKQKLVVPVPLKVSAMERQLIDENLDTFSRNGFDIVNNSLCTLPIVRDYILTIDDFYNLLENIKDDNLECDKVRDIMASKACRSSVMIGDKLDMNRLRQIVDNLAKLNKPWKCPHGRPTFMVLGKLD